MSEFDDIIQEFLTESHEGLDQLDRDLVVMEQGGATPELLAGIFRVVHTIKGTCGFLGFSKLETIAHRGENLLSRLRDGKLSPSPEITSALLSTFDAIRQILKQVETDGTEGETDYEELIATLEALQGPPDGALDAPDGALDAAVGGAPEREPGVDRSTREHRAGAPRPPSGSAATPERAEGAPSASGATSATDSSIRIDVGHLDRLMNLVGELVLARNALLQLAPVQDDLNLAATCQRLNTITTELQEGVMKTRMQPIDTIWRKLPRVVRDLAKASGKQIELQMQGRETELDRTLVEAMKDPLTHLIRNAVDHGIEPLELRVKHGKPVKGTISLRAFHEGGQVILEISDDGAGIDAEVIRQKARERGLVTAELCSQMSDREALSLIFLPGFSTAERVTNISGRGVGMDVVKTNVEKIGGKIDVESERGRGTTFRVRLPLTLAIVPALIVTVAGERYAIPNLSVVELVRMKDREKDAFALSRDGAFTREDGSGGIETVHGVPVYRLRGNLLPLVFLREALSLEESRVGSRESSVRNSRIPTPDSRLPTHDSRLCERSEPCAIIVLQADGRRFGLVVDRVNDTQEIVVKPLSPVTRENPPFSGATVLGDGRAALILDVASLARRTGVINSEDLPARVDVADDAPSREGTQETLLLFGLGREGRLAVPLSLVTRLEQFPRSAVETSGKHDVVQYRGQILPLIWLSRVLDTDEAVLGGEDGSASSERQAAALTEHRAGGRPRGRRTDIDPSTEHRERSERLRVLVHSCDDRSVGLVVDRIFDVVEETVTLLDSPIHRPGIIGTSVIRERVTDLLDLPGVIRANVPEFFEGMRG